ncbi:MAG: YjbH domain-containing protein [Thiogranum sp.]|nr:YjbH domain-containing protein [Thiogranum sp.]
MIFRWLRCGTLAAFLAMTAPGGADAEPNTFGQTGTINMPDARMAPDGTLSFGVSYFKPYLPLWSTVTVLPRAELTLRYTTIRDVPSELGKGFGDYKDKAADGKLLLLREHKLWPALALGRQDIFGTELFSSEYAVLSKRLGNTDYSLGYGNDRIDGLFGGMRHRPSWNPDLAFVVEYDANDYANDFGAVESGADRRDGEWTYAVEYRKGWLGAQLALQGDDIGVNTYVSIPLMKPEFVPKLHEPDPWTDKPQVAALDQWLADTGYAARLARALNERDYKNVRLGFDGETLSASFTNTRITHIGRAVGRAARIMLALGPAEMREIRIDYTVRDLPVLTYRFTDTRKLQRYFDGLMSRAQLDHYLEIGYAQPLAASGLPAGATQLSIDDDAKAVVITRRTDEGHFLSFRRESGDLGGVQFVPFNLGLFLNDPNGAARYDVFATAGYSRQIGRGRFLDTTLRFTLDENVSNVSRPSNSRLPHVRSDIALYRQEGERLKLARLLVNQYLHPAQRVYARLSAGLYEEMFAGGGGQVLYLPEQADWAVDFSADWLRQRDTEGAFGFRDYDTLTALGALHYRLPFWGLTATARAGRFLARDEGVRFEIKRRFRSGISIGLWYTRTNGDDITSPGSPGDPYYDKGVFASIPLSSMLTRDTQARAGMSLAPWTRDVGQMVVSPGDLYTDVERTLGLDSGESGPMSRFGQ